MKNNDVIALGKSVLQIEYEAIQIMEKNLDDNFAKACRILMGGAGKAITVGLGKSGHIARKISATLASTGTPSFFVHAGEAIHGDLGMIDKKDIVILISNSGETGELIIMLKALKQIAVTTISITSRSESRLAKESDVSLLLPAYKEACPLNLAPTTSTTATLALGDALAVCLLQMRRLTREGFARTHPAGSLGRKLITTVSDLMKTGDDIPIIKNTATLSQALLEITNKRLGCTLICSKDDSSVLIGIFTDGDLRRALGAKNADLQTSMQELIQNKYISCDQQLLAVEALKIMRDNKINALIVLDNKKKLAGIISIHDILDYKIEA